MANFYMMRAHHLSTNIRKISLKAVMKEESNQTIILAKRHNGTEVFLVGAPCDYNVNPGDMVTHTIDTGNGHRDRDMPLEIQGVLQIRDGQPNNEVDCILARYTYVMK